MFALLKIQVGARVPWECSSAWIVLEFTATFPTLARSSHCPCLTGRTMRCRWGNTTEGLHVVLRIAVTVDWNRPWHETSNVIILLLHPALLIPLVLLIIVAPYNNEHNKKANKKIITNSSRLNYRSGNGRLVAVGIEPFLHTENKSVCFTVCLYICC